MAFQKNRSLVDGLACLRVLAGSDEPVGCREMARLLGMHATRANRLLRTLKLVGLAAQDARRKYVPGPAIHVLAAQCLHGSSLIRAALPVLRGLDNSRHIVALGVLWRDRVSYLYHAAPGMPPDQALGRAGLYEASRSSIGRVLLARLDPASLEQVYADRPIAGFAGDLAAFREELTTVRRQGFSEVALGNGRVTLGVPVSTVAGLAFANVQPDDDRAELIAELQRQAQRIVRNLHGEG